MPASPIHRHLARVRSTPVRLGAAIALVCTVAACASTPSNALVSFAHATLRTPAGVEVGTATLYQVDGAIRLDLQVRGVADGTHGLHFHAVGRCDAPEFASAGGHLNPGGKKHGVKNPEGPHAGDLPNVIVQGGRSTGWTAMTLRVTNDASPTGLFDGDGTALVLHSAPDDEMTDPSGNSGARIACGVIERR